MRDSFIYLPRKLRSSFTRKAKKAFPKETHVFCLGKKDSSGILCIEDFFYPEIKLDKDGMGFSIPDEQYEQARKKAKNLGLSIVADLHSHPYTDCDSDPLGCNPSEIDLDHGYEDLIMGILQIYERNGKLRARYRFWPPTKPIILIS